MIYLDHAAATPMDKRVLEAMTPYMTEEFFNPSAAYLPAKKVAADYAEAKNTIAHAIGAKGVDVVMTAGATEANNLAFSAVSAGGKILYLATEHDSVRQKARQMMTRAGRLDEVGECEMGECGAEKCKMAECEIKVDQTGRIDLADLRAKLDDTVELVSVALVNNELGVIQPLSEIAEIVRETHLDRLRRGVKRPLYLHSDASQALNLLEVNVARLGVDMLTLNAAKIYGPKGVGALYVAHGVKLEPVTYGGGQERGLRAGTENVPGVIGFAKAVELAKGHLNGNRKKYAKWKQILLANLQGCEVVNKGKTLDNFVVLCYNGIDAERLVFLLEEKGVYVATGAACAASKGIRSHVLQAIGLTEAEIAGSLRLTMGETNSEEQIKAAADIINAVVAQEKERMHG